MQRGRHQPKRVRVVGRLPSLTASLLCFCAAGALVLGCERGSGSAEPGARSEAVPAKSGALASASAAAAAPSVHVANDPPRKLCEKELAQPGRRLPKTTFTPVSTPGVAPPKNEIPTGNGRWTWINFFAAWCAPCKEEMPRLRAFQEKLAPNLTVSFVSLDDDERQLRQLLGAQTDAGPIAGSALWLEAGKSRSAWLSALKMEDPPPLPAHVLVDPAGKVRCVLNGAINDADLPAIAAIVRR